MFKSLTVTEWVDLLPRDELDKFYQLYAIACERHGVKPKLDSFIDWLDQNYEF